MAPELRSRSAPSENGTAAAVTDSLAASTPVDPGHTAADAAHTAKAERKAAKAKAAEDADPDWPPQKTLLRGVLHQHMALAALTAGIMLVATAPGKRAKIGCGIYAGEICHCCAPSSHSSGPADKGGHAAARGHAATAIQSMAYYQIPLMLKAGTHLSCRLADAAADLLGTVPRSCVGPPHAHLAATAGPCSYLHAHRWHLHAAVHAGAGPRHRQPAAVH